MRFVWPTGGPRAGEGPPEAFVLFTARGGRPLRLGSNLAYEVWLDGAFAGDGGHRCVAGQAPLDAWDATGAREVVVRAHWIDPSRTVAYHRQLFDDPFLAVEDEAAWSCALDAGLRTTTEKATAQLPRQNVVASRLAPGPALALAPAALARAWSCGDLGLRPARVVPVDRSKLAELTGVTEGLFQPLAHEDLATGPRAWAKGDLPRGVVAWTFDLGRLALHRVEVTTDRESPALLCWSEVPAFADTWATTNRVQVGLVDVVLGGVAGGAPFGWRGGRYLHVIACAGAEPRLHAWRREYPLDWRDVHVADARDRTIVEACRANLVACVDGGLVDTCWRERGQWTGDLRTCALALRALATNDEPVALALRQVAASYVEDAAMVQAVWPASPPLVPLFIPGYHLAFCLAVAEHGAERLPDLAALARRSLERWGERYARGGLLEGFPATSWWFVDWDPERGTPTRATLGAADAVTHAWLHEAAAALGVGSPIDPGAFDAAFWTGTAYRLERPDGPESPQATAAAVSAFPASPHRDAALDWLLAQQAAGGLARRVTPYFGYFVARALATRSRALMAAFVREHYHARAARCGTIPEKTTDGASLAHGWSIGVAALLVEGA